MSLKRRIGRGLLIRLMRGREVRMSEFKRGDVVTYGGSLRVVTGTKGGKTQTIDLYGASNQTVNGYDKYDGPIYTKDGQRFVSANEGRVPKEDEWFLGSDGTPLQMCELKYTKGIDRVILLPVPELEPEHGFEVGDWVIFDEKRPAGTEIFEVTSVESKPPLLNGKYHISRVAKLPGPPLTEDDLMLVLSGEKIEVECYACGCDGDRGRVVTSNDVEGRCNFRHGQNQNGENYPIAYFMDGSIEWADGVPGNIFRVGGK
jgi:hypothetical protein